MAVRLARSMRAGRPGFGGLLKPMSHCGCACNARLRYSRTWVVTSHWMLRSMGGMNDDTLVAHCVRSGAKKRLSVDGNAER